MFKFKAIYYKQSVIDLKYTSWMLNVLHVQENNDSSDFIQMHPTDPLLSHYFFKVWL